MKRTIKYMLVLTMLVVSLVASACGSDADVASKNISTEAEQFKIVRRIVVQNDIKGDVLWDVQGRCSIENSAVGSGIELTCKEGPGQYRKHFIGLGDNDSWAATQLKSVNVSVYRTKVIIKPQNVVPDLDLVAGQGG